MKNLAKITTLSLLLCSVALFSSVTRADTLSLVGVNGSQTPSGEGVHRPLHHLGGRNRPAALLPQPGPRRGLLSVRPGPLNASQLSSNSPLADKEAAIIFSLTNNNQLSTVDAQLEIWAILDPERRPPGWIDTSSGGLPQQRRPARRHVRPVGPVQRRLLQSVHALHGGTRIAVERRNGSRLPPALRVPAAPTPGTELAASARHRGLFGSRRKCSTAASVASEH